MLNGINMRHTDKSFNVREATAPLPAEGKTSNHQESVEKKPETCHMLKTHIQPEASLQPLDLLNITTQSYRGLLCNAVVLELIIAEHAPDIIFLT